jgi:predicted DCC family thiol-disulfide oxidoreductase YuxK
MAPTPTQAPAASQGTHLVLYDGVCGLCNRLLQFLLKHDHRRVFSFASLQSATGRAMVTRWGGNPEELSSFYVIADFRTQNARAVTKSDAALFVARQLGWPWKALRAGGVLPRALRNRVYDAIARSRYQIFGRYDQCLLPQAEHRSRFVDNAEGAK